MVSNDDFTITKTRSTASSTEHANPYYESYDRQHILDIIRKCLKKEEIDEMKFGWFNPQKIAIKPVIRAKNIKKVIRNRLPERIRTD